MVDPKGQHELIALYVGSEEGFKQGYSTMDEANFAH